jgi:GAF domain-containing protein
MRFKASKGLSHEYQRAVTGHTRWRAGERGAEAIPVSDVRLDANLQGYQGIFDRERIRAMAFIPLALTRGVIGKFMLYYAEPHEFGRDELELGRAIANHVALATERKHAEVARVQSEQRLQAILDNSTTVVFLKDVEGRYILINRPFRGAVPHHEERHYRPNGSRRIPKGNRRCIQSQRSGCPRGRKSFGNGRVRAS